MLSIGTAGPSALLGDGESESQVWAGMNKGLRIQGDYDGIR